MSTSPASLPKFEAAFVPTTALAKSVAFDGQMMRVTLKDGREIGVPLAWFPILRKASLQQQAQYEIGGGGVSLHWPELDEDLSIAGRMAGADTRSM